MEKLWDGRDVELEIVERFARGLGLSINDWRIYWGYEPVVETNPVRLWQSMAEMLEAEYSGSDSNGDPHCSEIEGWGPDSDTGEGASKREKTSELLGDFNLRSVSDEELGARLRRALSRLPRGPEQ